MRKILVSLMILCFAGCAYGNVEADPEIHRVIGGLYSLACAVELNGNSEPQISQLRQYFSDVPNDWYSTVQISRVNNAVWAGVAVGKCRQPGSFCGDMLRNWGYTTRRKAMRGSEEITRG